MAALSRFSSSKNNTKFSEQLKVKFFPQLDNYNPTQIRNINKLTQTLYEAPTAYEVKL